MQECTLDVHHPKLSLLFPPTSRHNVGGEVSSGGERGSASVGILSLVASRELLGDKSASNLVTLIDENPPRPYELSFRIVAGLFTGYLVPYMHLGHEPDLFVAPGFVFNWVEDLTGGAVHCFPQTPEK